MSTKHAPPRAVGSDSDPETTQSQPRFSRIVSRVRVSLTVMITLLVVAGEFALLHAIYQHGAPTRSAQVVSARLDGALSTATPADGRAIDVSVRLASMDLSNLGIDANRLAPLHQAARDLRARGDAQSLLRLRQASTALSASLRAQGGRNTTDADIIYVLLLVGASLGWMMWFRRLVARHRKLQQSVTEHLLTARGEERLAALVRNAADLVLVCGADATITFVTPSISSVLGAHPDDVLASTCTELIEPEDRERFLAALGTLRVDEDRELQVRMRHSDGRVLDVEGTISDLTGDPAVEGLVITLRDVTSRVELENQLRHQAFHDSLSGLANRQLFSDRLMHALARSAGTTQELVVLFCDLDEFKNINDSLGHSVGDMILSEVGRRARTSTRAGDTVARLGGDEFAVLLENTDLDTAMTVAENLQQALQEPITIDGRVMLVHASIGLALSNADETTGEDLLRNADVAMYLAKQRGKSTIAVYDRELHAKQLERLSLRTELQQAIRSEELVLHYQPTIDLTSGEIAGFEALVRWQHPTRGLLPPLEFIPIAEQTGLIHALGLNVLRAACKAAVDFNATSCRPLTMAVNVTAQQLARPEFITEVFDALAEAGLPGDRLTLEITESVLLQDIDEVIERLTSLRARGIRIAIDDFGTGYSSLAYLRDLPLDILKVDKAFIDRVATHADDAALTESIVALSRSMNLTAVAEGVESHAQADWLTRTRCAYGQGFLWSRPVPKDEATALIVAGGQALRTPLAEHDAAWWLVAVDSSNVA